MFYTPDGFAVAGLRKPDTCRRSAYERIRNMDKRF